ncbi:MAG: hypothetical protein LBU66_01205 [Treponema sp.]|nr:hypothetical protein [Treponema sp.]
MVKREIGHLGETLHYYGMPLPVRGFVPAKTHGETAYEPSSFPSEITRSLQRGIHENVFASPNPRPGREMSCK